MLQRTMLTNHVTGRSTASVLFLSSTPHYLPHKSRFYGAMCPGGFNVSKIFDCHGKKWQLRTIEFHNNFYIAPFVINTGGVASRAPIVSTPLLRKIGALPPGTDRNKAWDNHGHVKVPSPLGELTTISDWGSERGESPTLDERYNLIGHGWAMFIDRIEVRAQDVNAGDISFDRAVHKLITYCPEDIVSYIHNPHNKKRVERELRAVMEAVKDKREIDKLAEAWAAS